MEECKTSLCFRGLDNFWRPSSVSAGFLQRPSATSRERPFRLAADCNCFIVSEFNPSRGFFHNPAATRLTNLETRVGFPFRLLAVCLHSNEQCKRGVPLLVYHSPRDGTFTVITNAYGFLFI